MSVDPLNPRGVPGTDAGKVAGSHSARRQDMPVEQSQAEITRAPGDSVELSAASRSLIEHADQAGRVPEGTVSPTRLHEVLRRLTDGFYDAAEVRTEVARRAQHDLGLSRPE